MIDYSMSEEQSLMKETINRFIKNNIINQAHEMDENRAIPVEKLQHIWDLGTILSVIPEEFGGYGMSYSPVMNAIILEELAYGDMAFAIAAMVPLMFLLPVLEMGTEEQKKKYLPLYCTAEFPRCTMAINEPVFGFDPVSLKTTAEKKNSSYIINGTKCFVPFAESSNHILTSASLNGKPNLFIVDKNNPGIKISVKEKNLGLYSLNTNTVTFTNCEISLDDRLGGNSGCDYDKLLQKTRTAMAAIGTGVSRASFEYARDYSKERIQFNEPIASRQAIAFMIAEMAYEVDSMRLLTWKAASCLEAGRDAKRESYLAKLYAGDMTMKIGDYGVQILGGHGYIRDHPVERYYRNGRGIAILEGMAIV